MKRISIFLLLAVSGLVIAQTKEKFLNQKFDEWFKESKPATKIVWVTDAKGCLHSVYDASTGIQLIAILGDDKKPVCRK